MKNLIWCIGLIFLTGCTLSSSREVKNAEKMLAQFQCNKIETTQMMHSSITAYHQQSLAATRQKAEAYVKSYQEGEKLFDAPLPEIIEQQYQMYHTACQSLGGIEPTISE